MALRRKRVVTGSAGTTLLEMLFAMTMFAIVFAAILLLFVTCANSYNNDSGRDQVNGSALMASQYMESDLRNASEVEAAYGGVSTGSSAIVLKVPSYNASGVIGGEYDQIIYKITGQSGLTRTTVPSAGSLRTSETDRVIDPNVDSLDFVYTVHDFFVGDGTTTTFTLAAAWSSAPACRVGGVPTTGVTYDSASDSASLPTAPAAGTQVEFVYTIDPANTAALPAVSQVDCNISAQSSPALSGSEQVRATARLRNKT